MLIWFVTSTLQFASPPSVLPDPSFSPCATPRPYVSTSFSITSTLLPRSFALFGLHQNSSAFFSTTCALFAKNNRGVPPLLPFRNAQAVPVSLTKIHAPRTSGSLTSLRRFLSVLGLFCTVLPPNTAAQAPKDNLAQAESLIHQGKFDESIALLNPLLKTDPQNVQARNSLGIALSQKGELSAANREFLAILKLNPKFSPALQNLAANEYTLKDFAASEKHFLAAAKILPDDPAVNSFLGKLTFKRGAYADAAKYLPKAAPLFQQEPALVVALVQSELEIGQDAAALSYLPQFNAASASLRAQFQLAVALSNRDHFEQAIPFFEAVQKQYPDSYDAAFNLAVCYVQTKAFSKAVELLSRLKEKGHKTAELDNLLAESYSGTGNLQAEIDSLREATQLEPEDENNYLDLAALCLDHDGFDLALEVLDVGLRHKPDSDRLIFQRGIAHAMKNEFDLAERDFQSASQLAPEKNLSYVGLGVSYMQTGNLPEAVRTLADKQFQLLKADPRHPSLHFKRVGRFHCARRGALPGARRRRTGRHALVLDRDACRLRSRRRLTSA